MIKIDLAHTNLSLDKVKSFEEQVATIEANMHSQTCLGADYLGWLTWPLKLDISLINKIQTFAKTLASKIDTLIVIGIGGSFLGAKAAIEALDIFDNKSVRIVFAGFNVSESYLKSVLFKHIYSHNSRFAICVISKSGSTLETSLTFDILKNYLKQHTSNKVYRERVVVITSNKIGALYELAKKEQFKIFYIPANIGGRYSVFTPAGLFPIAMAGIDIKEIIKGAQKAYYQTKEADILKNSAYQYAVARYLLQTQQNLQVEMLIAYEPSWSYMNEWIKQLFAESEGKNDQGLLPVTVNFTRDLHSLGQYLQQGPKDLFFETTLVIENMKNNINEDINKFFTSELLAPENSFFKNHTFKELNHMVQKAVIQAHSQGKIQNIVLKVQDNSPETVGYLFYWMMKACAVSAYLLELNPFDQPGVNLYKANLLKLFADAEE